MNTHKTLVAALALTAALSEMAEATLLSRLDGQAVYDTTHNITWVADARLAASNTFGLPVNTEFNVPVPNIFHK